MTPEQAYDEICHLARDHALILHAAGGVVTIVHPTTQKEEGLWDQIQYIHGLAPSPSMLAQQREAQFKARQLPLLADQESAS